MLEAQQLNKLNTDPAGEGLSANISERLFYFDCSPEFARGRTKRAEVVAAILNEGRSFGTERMKEIIRFAFQVELGASKDAAEAAAKMSRLVSIINLRLNKGLGLGPQGLPVKNTLYFVMDGLVFTQRLSLDLKPVYKKELETVAQNHFAA
jgi:hypothetical protein